MWFSLDVERITNAKFLQSTDWNKRQIKDSNKEKNILREKENKEKKKNILDWNKRQILF